MNSRFSWEILEKIEEQVSFKGQFETEPKTNFSEVIRRPLEKVFSSLKSSSHAFARLDCNILLDSVKKVRIINL